MQKDKKLNPFPRNKSLILFIIPCPARGMIKQGSNYANSTVKEMDKKGYKKKKQDDSNSSAVESSEESFVDCRSITKDCILYGICSQTVRT